MKKFHVMNVITLAVLIIATSMSVISTTAQTAVKRDFIATDTTTKQMNPNNSFDVQIIADENAQKFILAVNNPMEEKLRINIAGPDGVGFSDLTKSTYYRKRISLGDAQDGNYTVTISSPKKTYSKTIRLNTATVQTRSINVE